MGIDIGLLNSEIKKHIWTPNNKNTKTYGYVILSFIGYKKLEYPSRIFYSHDLNISPFLRHQKMVENGVDFSSFVQNLPLYYYSQSIRGIENIFICSLRVALAIGLCFPRTMAFRGFQSNIAPKGQILWQRNG